MVSQPPLRGVPTYTPSSTSPTKTHQASSTLPSPRKRKEMMRELMKMEQEHLAQQQQLQSPLPRQRSTESLPRQQRHLEDLSSLRRSSVAAASASSRNTNRISVFEPYPMRDTVQHFCEKHLDKIKAYMESLSVKLPLPIKCTIEERKVPTMHVLGKITKIFF